MIGWPGAEYVGPVQAAAYGGMSEESHGALLCHPTFVSYQKSESFVQRVCLEPSGRT